MDSEFPPSQGGLGWVSLCDKRECAADEQQRTEEGTHGYIQLTTPNEPASAVNTAMITLRSFPQLKVVVCDMLNSGLPPLQREG